MTPIPAARYAVFALTTLALGGCYYTSPYGYAPYYAPAPATLTQREIPVTPAAPATTAPAGCGGGRAAGGRSGARLRRAGLSATVSLSVSVLCPAYYPGWYGWGAPAISVGFWGGWGGGWRGRGGYGHRPWGGGHWGGGWGGHRH